MSAIFKKDTLTQGSTTSTEITWEHNGPMNVKVYGTFSAGTVTVRSKDENGTYVSLGSDAVFTSAGQVNFQVPRGDIIQAELSSADASDSITVELKSLH